MSDNNANKEPVDIPEIPIPEKMPDELVPLYQWWILNGKNFMTALLIGLIVATGIIYFKNYRAGQNVKASTVAFSSESVEDLETANADFGSTESGPVIRLRLAKAYYDEQRYEDAANTYRQFAIDNSDSPLLDSALIGEAVSFEALGKFDEAAGVFDSVFAKGEASSCFKAALLGKARCLAAAEKKDDAKALIKGALKDEAEAKAFCTMIDRYKKPVVKNFSISDLSGLDAQEPLAPAAE